MLPSCPTNRKTAAEPRPPVPRWSGRSVPLPGSLGAVHTHLALAGNAPFPCAALDSPSACLLPSPGWGTAHRSPSPWSRRPEGVPGSSLQRPRRREVLTPALSPELTTAPNPPRHAGPRLPTTCPTAPALRVLADPGGRRQSVLPACAAGRGAAALPGVPARTLRPRSARGAGVVPPTPLVPPGPHPGPGAPRPPHRTPSLAPPGLLAAPGFPPRAPTCGPRTPVAPRCAPPSSPPRPYLAALRPRELAEAVRGRGQRGRVAWAAEIEEVPA